MVGANTMMAATPWIRRNMLNADTEQENKRPTEAELRVRRCAERLHVPDWYRNYFKPNTRFLKDKTPFECRPPSWKSMTGKAGGSKREGTEGEAGAASTAAQTSRTPEWEPQSADDEITDTRSTKSMPSLGRSLNSNYRISRKVDNARNKGRLPISITPTSSDSDDWDQPVASGSSGTRKKTPVNLSNSLRSPLFTSNTFPRMRRSRKIENINIVFPADFTPKTPRREREQLDEAAASESMACSTPRTHYTLTKNIEMPEQSPDDCDSTESAETSQKSNYTSFLLAEVEPRGVITTMQMFAGLDSDESEEHERPARCPPSPATRFFDSDESEEHERRARCSPSPATRFFDSDESEGHERRARYSPSPATRFFDSDASEEYELPARCSPSPLTRFFNSERKSVELERIVQNSREVKRGNSLIREIIGELDRSIAESMVGARRGPGSAEPIDTSQNFVKKVVYALEHASSDSSDDSEGSFEVDSELAKSISISFKSFNDGSSSVDGGSEDECDKPTPLPTYDEYRDYLNYEQQQHEESKEEEEEEKEEEEEEKKEKKDEDKDEDKEEEKKEGEEEKDEEEDEEGEKEDDEEGDNEEEEEEKQEKKEGKEEKDEEEEENEDEEVHWISASANDLARTSSRLSVMSRGSVRSGFQCTSGRCSPGLSPIKSDRKRDDCSPGLSSQRGKISRQLFRIDETGVVDSGFYSDRSGATSQATPTPGVSDNQSPSPMSPFAMSPTRIFDAVTRNAFFKMSRPFFPRNSLRA